METPLDDVRQALGCGQMEIEQSKHGSHSKHLVNKNTDEQPLFNRMDSRTSTRPPILGATPSSGPGADDSAFMCASFQLPSEILLCVLDNLTVNQLMPCQLVSRHFRAVARMVLMDKLGGCILRQQQLQYQKQLDRRQGQASGIDGLPPLPHRHHHSSSISNHPGRDESTSQYPLLNIQSQQDHQHHLHHHLYQNQSMEGLSQHPHTDLHIHQQSHSYSVQSHSPSPTPNSPPSLPPQQQQQQQGHCRDPGYVAPGTIALFLFPYHDHTPTGWQERQSVHLRCTGMDRATEQLIFSPIHPDTGDCLKFNTNSWNLPTTLASSASSMARRFAGGSMDSFSMNQQQHDTSNFPTAKSTTGLDLFDYATGRPQSSSRDTSSVDGMLSYSFTDQYKTVSQQDGNGGNISTSAGMASMDSSPRSPSQPSRSSFLSSSPSSSSPVSRFSTSLSSHHSSASSWLTTNGGAGDHYSIIGIKHGDWPEDYQIASRWWNGDLHSSMTQQSMVFLPWSASPGGQGSVVDFQQRLIRQYEQQHQQHEPTNSSPQHYPLHTHPTDVPCGASMRTEDSFRQNQSQDMDGEEKECTRIHRHHMYLSSRRPRNPPTHHHQYFCLHHDQLMTDIAAFNTMKTAAATNIAADFRKDKMPMATAGSKHLSICYGARVTESKRCQFCLTSPCKANLEIQVKFSEVRVSLDWILAGFVPDIMKKPPIQTRRSGQVPAA